MGQTEIGIPRHPINNRLLSYIKKIDKKTFCEMSPYSTEKVLGVVAKRSFTDDNLINSMTIRNLSDDNSKLYLLLKTITLGTYSRDIQVYRSVSQLNHGSLDLNPDFAELGDPMIVIADRLDLKIDKVIYSPYAILNIRRGFAIEYPIND